MTVRETGTEQSDLERARMGTQLRSLETVLRSQTAEATKAGRHWGRRGAIALCRRRLEALTALGEGANGFAALASTYYAAAHLAAGKIRLHPGAVLWIARFLRDLSQAEYWIGRHEMAVKFDKMSAGALDIYAAVMELIGEFWQRFSREQAVLYYQKALRAADVVKFRGDLSTDDRALNLIRRAGIMVRMAVTPAAQQAAGHLFQEAFSLLPQLTPLTAVRVMRSCGEYCEVTGNLDDAERRLIAAQDRARREGLRDQAQKIDSILARVKKKQARARKKRLGRGSWF